MKLFQQMPDVISNVQTLNINRVDDYMEEENESMNNEDPLLSHHLNQHNNSNLLNLDRLDSLISVASSNHQSTVDMSSLNPMLNNYGIMSMNHQINCDNGSVESVLPSDSDSFISDIDMIA